MDGAEDQPRADNQNRLPLHRDDDGRTILAVPKSTRDNWLSAPETAVCLGVTLRTVYKLIDEEGLPAYKIRRVIRIRRVDVERSWQTDESRPASCGISSVRATMTQMIIPAEPRTRP